LLPKVVAASAASPSENLQNPSENCHLGPKKKSLLEVLPKVAAATAPSPSKYRSVVGHNMQLGLLPKAVAALTPFSYENHSTAILWAPLA